jgi:hypothetical protein
MRVWCIVLREGNETDIAKVCHTYEQAKESLDAMESYHQEVCDGGCDVTMEIKSYVMTEVVH